MYDTRGMAGTPEPLIILDGDLGSLVALSCASDEAVSIGSGRSSGPCAAVWVPSIFGDTHRDRSAACDRQAALFNARKLNSNDHVEGLRQIGDGPYETPMLFASIHQARTNGSDRVIWPEHPGRTADETAIDLERAASIIDRALLVEQLGALDRPAGSPRIVIETPHADLSDRQLAELAADLSVPVKTLWWWGGQSDAAQRHRDRWLGLFRETGLWRHAETTGTVRA